MSNRTELDLTRIGWPICLLEFTRALDATAAGCDLKVLIQDRDVLQSVQTITVNSHNRILSIEQLENQFSLCVRKC